MVVPTDDGLSAETLMDRDWITCGAIVESQHARDVLEGSIDTKNKDEPNTQNLEYDPKNLIAPIDWEADDDDDDDEAVVEINAAEEECEMDVALDT